MRRISLTCEGLLAFLVDRSFLRYLAFVPVVAESGDNVFEFRFAASLTCEEHAAVLFARGLGRNAVVPVVSERGLAFNVVRITASLTCERGESCLCASRSSCNAVVPVVAESCDRVSISFKFRSAARAVEYFLS